MAYNYGRVCSCGVRWNQSYRSGFYKELCRRRWVEHHFVKAGILSRKTTDWFYESTGWNSATG